MHNFRKVISIIVLFNLLLFSQSLLADEGMWLLSLLKDYNEKELKEQGLEIDVEDIYSTKNTSLKDAIISFGGYCTGSVVSSEGLLLTNHHCGVRSIQSHSSVEKDYLKKGFWAMNKEEELPNPKLFVKFVVEIKEVTKEVLFGTIASKNEVERSTLISSNIDVIKHKMKQKTGYEVEIKPFYQGSRYFLFLIEKYEDVRLVGAPPTSIGSFGGDTDNWVYPRHSADFSLFRVYTSPEGKPAKYSQENIPLKPKKYLKIASKGIQENDFTMVLGFPGRTQEYLTSHAIKQIMEDSNPQKVLIRTKRLQLLKEEMKKSDGQRIKYTPEYSSVSNYHKKWSGENLGLIKSDAVGVKEAFEKSFLEWAKKENKHQNLINEYEKVYLSLNKVDRLKNHIYEGLFSVSMIRWLNNLSRFTTLQNLSEKDFETQKEQFIKGIDGHYKQLDVEFDRKMLREMLTLYRTHVAEKYHLDIYNLIDEKYNGDIDAYTLFLYKKSKFANKTIAHKFLTKVKKEDLKKVNNDPFVTLVNQIRYVFIKNVLPIEQMSGYELKKLHRQYLKAIIASGLKKRLYPDANSTLRLAYGKVEGYQPKDGVSYQYYTTLKGVMQKEAGGKEEYAIPDRLKELYRTKDFGKYTNKKGEIPVCFIASNHTTGGNSGSPVLNGKGELIGLNFDRNWQGTMSDIHYDRAICRNISVDIRYVLFLVDKYAGASYLVEEMMK